MNRIFAALLVTLVGGVCLVAAGGGSGPFSYQSPNTSLTYTYTTQNGLPDGEVQDFEIATAVGQLIGRVSENGSTTYVSARIGSGPAGKVLLTVVEPSLTATATLELSFGSFGNLSFLLTKNPDVLNLIATAGLDCIGLETSSAYLALQEATNALNIDIDQSVTAPDHLVQVAEAVTSLKFLPAQATECQGYNDPQAGACHLIINPLETCESCCQTTDPIEGGLCLHEPPACVRVACRTARLASCSEGVVNLSSSECEMSCVNNPPSCDIGELCLPGPSCAPFYPAPASCCFPGGCPINDVCCRP